MEWVVYTRHSMYRHVDGDGVFLHVCRRISTTVVCRVDKDRQQKLNENYIQIVLLFYCCVETLRR